MKSTTGESGRRPAFSPPRSKNIGCFGGNELWLQRELQQSSLAQGKGFQGREQRNQDLGRNYADVRIFLCQTLFLKRRCPPRVAQHNRTKEVHNSSCMFTISAHLPVRIYIFYFPKHSEDGTMRTRSGGPFPDSIEPPLFPHIAQSSFFLKA